jgi:RNA polymerase sigma factor (sigma-70 family)
MGLPPFQAVLDAYADDVYRFLVYLVGSQEADDCFQETFLAALRGYPRLRSNSNVRSWLLKVAHNKAIDHIRARRRQPVPVQEVDLGVDEEILASREVWRRVQLLPEKQRLAVAYRFACDLSYREIAKILGTSEPAARQDVSAGLKRLREVMVRD